MRAAEILQTIARHEPGLAEDGRPPFESRGEAESAAFRAGLLPHEFRIRSRCFLRRDARGRTFGELRFWIAPDLANELAPVVEGAAAQRAVADDTRDDLAMESLTRGPEALPA